MTSQVLLCVKDKSMVSSPVATIVSVDSVCSHNLNITAVEGRKPFWEGTCEVLRGVGALYSLRQTNNPNITSPVAILQVC